MGDIPSYAKKLNHILALKDKQKLIEEEIRRSKEELKDDMLNNNIEEFKTELGTCKFLTFDRSILTEEKTNQALKLAIKGEYVTVDNCKRTTGVSFILCKAYKDADLPKISIIEEED